MLYKIFRNIVPVIKLLLEICKKSKRVHKSWNSYSTILSIGIHRNTVAAYRLLKVYYHTYR